MLTITDLEVHKSIHWSASHGSVDASELKLSPGSWPEYMTFPERATPDCCSVLRHGYRNDRGFSIAYVTHIWYRYDLVRDREGDVQFAKYVCTEGAAGERYLTVFND